MNEEMTPVTRNEILLAKAAGETVAELTPITRKELFLAKLAGQDVTTPAPITREEMFLQKAIDSGGAGGSGGTTIKNQNKTITANGQYTADSGYTGLGTVTVAVPEEEPVLQDKQITANGTYQADSGYTGLGTVTVAVPEEEPVLQDKQITANGTYAADAGYDGLGEVVVDVPSGAPVIQPLSVTANGTYEAPAGVDGYSPVTVAIESGGGATIATGSFTPGISNPNHTVTHGLGVVPNFAICYRSMKSLTTTRENSFVYLAKLNGVGTMVATHLPNSLGKLYDNGNAGQDTTHAITDIPTDYAPYVGAYGATENEITFGFNYDSSRGDTYFCFEGGWDTFYWIVGVI